MATGDTDPKKGASDVGPQQRDRRPRPVVVRAGEQNGYTPPPVSTAAAEGLVKQAEKSLGARVVAVRES